MASLTQWTWVWASSGSWWWTGRPEVLQSMGSQRVRHDWATELNWTELVVSLKHCVGFCWTMKWISPTYATPSLLDLPFHPLGHHRTSWVPCYRVAPHWFSVLRMAGCICQFYSPNLPPSPSPTMSTCPLSGSLFLPCKHFFTSTIFLDSLYMCLYDICSELSTQLSFEIFTITFPVGPSCPL